MTVKLSPPSSVHGSSPDMVVIVEGRDDGVTGVGRPSCARETRTKTSKTLPILSLFLSLVS